MRLLNASRRWRKIRTLRREKSRCCSAHENANGRLRWYDALFPIIKKRTEGPSKAQVLGCIIGQCTGDALGRPVETQKREQTAEYSAKYVRSKQPPVGVIDRYPFGQYTDDSQLAREFLVSIVHNNGRFVPQDYAERIAGMFQPPSTQYKIGTVPAFSVFQY